MSKYASWVEKNLDVRSKHADEYLCLCVFHDNKSTPSLCINVRKGVYVCYSCDAKGSIARIAEKLSVPVAAIHDPDDLSRRLRDRTGTNQGKPKATVVKEYPESWLNRYGWRQHHSYWGMRGFDRETTREFKLGYDPDHDAVTIPIRNINGGLMGVVKRHCGTECTECARWSKSGASFYRYKYPKGFKISWHLFNACSYVNDDIDNLVITEGSLDAMLMHQSGFDAVALLGASLHPHQITLINQLGPVRVTLMLDNDRAGRHSTPVVANQLMRAGHIVYLANDRRFRTQYRKQHNGRRWKDAGDLTHRQRVMAIDDSINYVKSIVQ